MPRQARLDAPGVLHHVMARGIERRRIFFDDRDRDDFLRRLSELATSTALVVYAWSLMPNHFHLLVRTGRVSLSQNMRSLMSGYAGYFNRRHRRHGHVFQNRFKSIVCDEEVYLLELVRYLHLNPLRAKVVKHIRELERYPYSGHSALLGRVARPWQKTADVLRRFSDRRRQAIKGYQEFVLAGVHEGRRADLTGGGLLRSHGGWVGVLALRRGREAYRSDERVGIGSSLLLALALENNRFFHRLYDFLLRSPTINTLILSTSLLESPKCYQHVALFSVSLRLSLLVRSGGVMAVVTKTMTIIAA